MSIALLHYVIDAFFILLLTSMACLIFIFIIHFFVPKVMIKTYFKEPYFSPLEIKLFTGPLYAYMRTAMLMRLAGWPDCGKKRGIPATAHEVSPVWFQIVSRVFIRALLTVIILYIVLGLFPYFVFTVLGVL